MICASSSRMYSAYPLAADLRWISTGIRTMGAYLAADDFSLSNQRSSPTAR